MSNLAVMNEKSIAIAQAIQDKMIEVEQVNIKTLHTLHGGVYTRTVELKAGEALVGALVKIPTTLIICGNIKVYVGGEIKIIDGTRIITASANRKQVMTALKDTSITMIFATEAKTVREAEDEFTDESTMLMSRTDEAINIIDITGE